MLILEDGLTLCGRCVLGYETGHIIKVDQRTYTIKWRDGLTKQLRPDLDDEELELIAGAAE